MHQIERGSNGDSGRESARTWLIFCPRSARFAFAVMNASYVCTMMHGNPAAKASCESSTRACTYEAEATVPTTVPDVEQAAMASAFEASSRAACIRTLEHTFVARDGETRRVDRHTGHHSRPLSSHTPVCGASLARAAHRYLSHTESVAQSFGIRYQRDHTACIPSI